MSPFAVRCCPELLAPAPSALAARSVALWLGSMSTATGTPASPAATACSVAAAGDAGVATSARVSDGGGELLPLPPPVPPSFSRVKECRCKYDALSTSATTLLPGGCSLGGAAARPACSCCCCTSIKSKRQLSCEGRRVVVALVLTRRSFALLVCN